MPVCTGCLLKHGRMMDSEYCSSSLICWSIWPSTSEDASPTNDIKEAFQRLPLPCTNQEFNIDPIKKKDLETETEPLPYVHLKRTKTFILSRTNVMVMELKGDVPTVTMTQLVKVVTAGMSCSFHLLCSLVSCSQACHCSVKCSNKPFRKEKRIKIVKTQHCGWGAIALETIENDDFVIEFVGEDDAMCEDRLQDMRQRRDQNFYMCKVSKDFVIDATFRGNACRFINHSCQPNCRLEKWQVNGKTRLGVFASETIKVGMPLTYNYRYFRLAHNKTSRESSFITSVEISVQAHRRYAMIMLRKYLLMYDRFFGVDSPLLLVQRKNVSAGFQTAEGNCE
ncbi:hypothetical protein HU200_005350 [Digitaria exilis]|uniref:SET domain-containing protein n=1 Tax=Digitaria exilis TaxID=1010633 RepID=A0A835FTI2_9POAL|nr:hypothetical protein HU200_005350 [Digitaria exilis]